MAIDWAKIEGYREDMTADEKLELLEKHEPTPAPKDEPTPAPAPKDMKGFIPKAQFDKVASDLAAANKKLRAKMTEEEQKEAERLAEQEAIQQELTTLRHEKTVSTYKANYLSLGFDGDLALETAEAMADNDMERVFANMKKHSEAMKKSLTAEIMKNTPVPPAGDEPEDLKKQKELAMLRKSMGLPDIK